MGEQVFICLNGLPFEVINNNNKKINFVWETKLCLAYTMSFV